MESYPPEICNTLLTPFAASGEPLRRPGPQNTLTHRGMRGLMSQPEVASRGQPQPTVGTANIASKALNRAFLDNGLAERSSLWQRM
jgi:hypothetical protein